MAEKSELDILIPDSEITLASGEKIVIRPFSFAKLPKVVSLINSIGVGIFTLMEASKDVTLGDVNQEAGTVPLEVDDLAINKVNEFIESYFEEIVEVLTIYCRRPKEFFLDEDQGPDIEEVCQIILLIVERHLNFFMKTLRPILAQVDKAKAYPGATL